MRRAAHVALLSAAVLNAACREIPAPPEPQPFTLAPADVWSGAEVLIRSAGFAATPTLPAVVLDEAALAVRRIDDTTLAARLPDLPGPHDLTVSSPYVLGVAAPIRLHGFERSEVGPEIQGIAQPLPGRPAVVGMGATGLARWDLATGAILTYPDSLHAGTCVWGVGPSFAPGRVVLHSTPCNDYSGWKAWALAPTPSVTDTMLLTSDRFVAELAPGRSLSAAHHSFTLAACDTASCASQVITAEGTYDVVISPRGDRAVPAWAYMMQSGVAVLDARAPSVGYYVPQLIQAPGAAFSSEGDTLFLAGMDSAFEGRLVVMRAADGQVLVPPVPINPPLALALDPVQPLLYMLGWRATDGRVVLEVRDRATGALIAAPAALTHAICVTCVGVVHVLPSPLEHRIYVVNTAIGFYTAGTRADLLVFSTPP